jgi:hypothetical protein
VVNKCYTKHQRKYVINPNNVLASNLFPSAKASGFRQSPVDPYDLSSDKQAFLAATSIAEMTPGPIDSAVRLLTTESHN